MEDYPVATFQFKYRSRGKDFWQSSQTCSACLPTRYIEALKQLLVIPRSPSPLPLEERNPEDLTPTEAQELIRRQRVRRPLSTGESRSGPSTDSLTVPACGD